MTRIGSKNKIQLLPITPELVIEILSDKEEPFSYSFINELYNDKNIPKEKLAAFIQQVLELTRQKYIKPDVQPDGRIFIVTNKWRWDKFHDSKKVRTLGVAITIILAALALWNPFNFSCNGSDKPSDSRNADTTKSKLSHKSLTIPESTSIYVKPQQTLIQHKDTVALKQNTVDQKKINQKSEFAFCRKTDYCGGNKRSKADRILC